MWPFKKKNKLKYDMNLDYKDLFTRIQRNSIQMIFIKDASIAMGNSKFGGTPHLPKTYQWPYYTGDIQDGSDRSNVVSRPLMFIDTNKMNVWQLMAHILYASKKYE